MKIKRTHIIHENKSKSKNESKYNKILKSTIMQQNRKVNELRQQPQKTQRFEEPLNVCYMPLRSLQATQGTASQHTSAP